MPRAGPRKVHRYTDEFKLTAVRLSQQPGVQVQTVAAALEIHPFMLSKWRKAARDGLLRGSLPNAPAAGPAREIAALQVLERQYAALKEEHDLLKKAIRFWSARKAIASHSSPSSSRSTTATRSGRSARDMASPAAGSTRGSTAGKARVRARTEP